MSGKVLLVTGGGDRVVSAGEDAPDARRIAA